MGSLPGLADNWAFLDFGHGARGEGASAVRWYLVLVCSQLSPAHLVVPTCQCFWQGNCGYLPRLEGRRETFAVKQ